MGLAVLGLLAWAVAAIAADPLPLTGHHRLGSGQVPVPNLGGMPEAQARALLQEIGLRGRVRLERGGCGDPAQAGLVVDQSPSPEQGLPPGSWVDITVCPAPSPARRVEVPDLGGLEENQARILLKNAGLSLAVARRVSCAEPQAASRVIWQAPAAGQQAKRGQRVAVRICRGSK